MSDNCANVLMYYLLFNIHENSSMKALKKSLYFEIFDPRTVIAIACLDINWRYIKGMPGNQFSQGKMLSSAYLKVLIVSASATLSAVAFIVHTWRSLYCY